MRPKSKQKKIKRLENQQLKHIDNKKLFDKHEKKIKYIINQPE